MKNTFICFLLFICLAPLASKAQNTMYFMEHLPQNLSLNPALTPFADLYFLLPGVSNFGAYNKEFNYKELKEFGDNLSRSDYDPRKFVESIGNYNEFYTEGKVNIFAFGFRLKDGSFLSFQQSLNGYLSLTAKSDLVFLLADLDDLPSEDFPLVVDGISLKTNNYVSWCVTYSRKINEQLTLGIRPQLNFNMISVRTEGITYIVTEDKLNDEYEHEIIGEVQMGLPVKISPDVILGDELLQDRDLFPDGWLEDIKFSDFFGNATFSVDLGATYLLNEWTFSASLLNVGSSKWRKNGYILTGTDDIIRVEDSKKIKGGIPPKIFLAANRQFSPKWNYGLVFYNAFVKNYPSTSATLSLNGNIDDMVSTSFSYTAGYRFANIGLGLRLRLLPGTDLFMVTDNIIQLLGYKQARRLTAAFGINITVGANNLKLKKGSTTQPI
jgi:hypothetical protein